MTFSRWGVPGIFAAALALSVPAHAALPIGQKAPDFTTQASQGGKEFTYTLTAALKKGPVVLYFYPAAFTKGCTVEAHDFAEAIPQFQAAGASVIGVSMDPIAKLDKFSVSECRSAFPVASDADGKITREYDAKLPLVAMAKRVSYVIDPNGKVVLAYSSMSPDEHVERTLAAVKAIKAGAQQ
ncbi:peroxiredoxin [Kozakia baliensis]|uniref:thioredoxin-dependent peroxiredoxin n=1 Tax=Kozakia baliensis TaxID=153496 RepID=A0A1D8UV68_9PROT|nr:peroxiredoxin [Kozakia baliensis]AOX17518.1 alkyl hydroperoxide reductase [Kozakia baliensis]GBR30826.1 thioredoxin peroxidase [Kozakia baliensis NRIC 0488]GEL63014.1 peroxiredoxin [Kozakia baliensis]